MKLTNDTHKKIMEVALRLFSEKGYHSTTTKQIAEAADLNEVTIFRHFGSKSNLFHEITEYYVRESQVDDILAGLEKLTVEESIALIANRIYKTCIKNRKLYKIQMKLTEDEKEIVRLKLSRRVIRVLEGYFTKLKQEGKIDGNPQLMAVTLVNSLLGAFTIEILGDGTVTDLPWEEQVKEHARQFTALYKL